MYCLLTILSTLLIEILRLSGVAHVITNQEKKEKLHFKLFFPVLLCVMFFFKSINLLNRNENLELGCLFSALKSEVDSLSQDMFFVVCGLSSLSFLFLCF